MLRKQLVWCVQCNVLAVFSPLDRTPEYENQDGEWKVLEKDDQASFLRAHQGHHLEELRPIKETFISDQSYSEPVKASYFEATNGKQRFVIRKSRKSIFDPQRYELIPGKLHLVPSRPFLDGKAIRKELENRFVPRELSSKKIRRFVRRLDEAVSHLNPAELKRAPFEGHKPSLWYFFLHERVLKKALQGVRGFLTEKEAGLLGEFVRENLKEPLFMAMAAVEFELERSGEKASVELIAA